MEHNINSARYSRQVILPEIGKEGQAHLKNARVLIVGIGGLGSPVALYLCGAGIGTIGLMDNDVVSLSNLQRQVLFTEDDIGTLKVTAAEARLKKLNSDIQIEAHTTAITSQHAQKIIPEYDLIIDGTDNFTAHYLINDACVLGHKPLVYGSVERFAGEVGLIIPHESPCYRCLYPQAPPPGIASACSEIGVLGVVPGVIGSLQAAEALKFILSIGRPLTGRIIRFDALSSSLREYATMRNSNCTMCGFTGDNSVEFLVHCNA